MVMLIPRLYLFGLVLRRRMISVILCTLIMRLSLNRGSRRRRRALMLLVLLF